MIFLLCFDPMVSCLRWLMCPPLPFFNVVYAGIYHDHETYLWLHVSPEQSTSLPFRGKRWLTSILWPTLVRHIPYTHLRFIFFVVQTCSNDGRLCVVLFLFFDLLNRCNFGLVWDLVVTKHIGYIWLLSDRRAQAPTAQLAKTAVVTAIATSQSKTPTAHMAWNYWGEIVKKYQTYLLTALARIEIRKKSAVTKMFNLRAPLPAVEDPNEQCPPLKPKDAAQSGHGSTQCLSREHQHSQTTQFYRMLMLAHSLRLWRSFSASTPPVCNDPRVGQVKQSYFCLTGSIKLEKSLKCSPTYLATSNFEQADIFGKSCMWTVLASNVKTSQPIPTWWLNLLKAE